jgi:hypothetical protein
MTRFTFSIRKGLFLFCFFSMIVSRFFGQEVCRCSGEGKKAIDGVEKGELKPLKDYLENGGDPLYTCTKPYASVGYAEMGLVYVLLSDVVMRSKSFEIVAYYLSYPIPEDIKRTMLLFYSVPDCSHCENLVSLLIDKKAFFKVECCISECKKTIKNLKKGHYDFTRIDSSGYNLLMDYASCPEVDYPRRLIRLMKYLIRQGCQTNLVGNDGKTLKTIAVHPKVKKFVAKL